MLKNAISLFAMIYFSPAKINLGLQILERRKDGYHNLRSVMYPIPLCDIIEISQLPGQDVPVKFSESGASSDAEMQNNLCIKAWKLMSSEGDLPPLAIHLHKQIPVGAGLGGGSSNASTVLTGINALSGFPASPDRLKELAEQLGSDCPFFLQTEPMMMEGRGEILSRVDISLKSFYLVVLFPGKPVSTAEAYGSVSPRVPEQDLGHLISLPLFRWRDQVVNDFEESIFDLHPQLRSLKLALYSAGALYASMSGSGSSLYGIFEKRPDLPGEILEHVIWKGAI